ncbi:hypothetical protein ES705_33142 [subsurface metagenome]
MRTREVVSRVKKFRDYYGFDIPSAPELKTKQDCKKALLEHKRWLEGALSDALAGVDQFIIRTRTREMSTCYTYCQAAGYTAKYNSRRGVT